MIYPSLSCFVAARGSRCTAMLAGLRTLIHTEQGPDQYPPSTRLRHDALSAELAGMSEHGGVVLSDMLVEELGERFPVERSLLSGGVPEEFGHLLTGNRPLSPHIAWRLTDRAGAMNLWGR
jgi:hypothetical protein